MKIIHCFKKNSNGSLLVILENKCGDLFGELYFSGVCNPGKWYSRAKFEALTRDCSEYCVREYFGFTGASVVEVS